LDDESDGITTSIHQVLLPNGDVNRVKANETDRLTSPSIDANESYERRNAALLPDCTTGARWRFPVDGPFSDSRQGRTSGARGYIAGAFAMGFKKKRK